MIISKNLFAKVSLLVFSTFIAGLFLTSVCFGQLPGGLDPAFYVGRTTTKIGSLNDFANASAIQADGKIVVVGYTNNGANFDFAVARYNTDGTLDMSFGNAGRVVTPVGSGEDIANAVVIQPDNKILVGGHGDNFALVRYNTDGTLDNSFDGDGKLTTNINGSINSLAVKSGKIIAAGYSIESVANYEMAVARYNLSNGALDNSFSGDGKLVLPISAGEDIATAVGVQLNDRIVLAGYSSNGSNFDFALARLNADGTLDTTLNGTGKVATPIGSGNDAARAMLILPDNRIVVGGYSEAAGSVRNFAVARYSVFGVLDNSFDTDGKLTTNISGNYNSIYSLALQTDGKLVAAGYAVTDGTGGYFRFAAARYDTDGALDNTFDSDGKVTTQFDGFSENQGRAVAIQADGKIVVAGYASNGIENDFNNTNNDFAVARFNTNGSLDGTFGNRVFTGFSGEDAQAKSVATQADGKIVVAGYTLNGANRDFAVARYNTDGLLDLTFGNNGRVLTAVGSGNDDAYAVAVQADGKIVVAGVGFNAGIKNFAIVRYNPNGSLDNTFGGGNGKMITAVGIGDSTAFAMAIQTNGRIVLAGLATQGGAADFAIVRYGPNGSLDTGFGNGGRVIMPVGTDAETAYAVKVQTDGKIIVGGTAGNGGMNADFALVRLNTNGSLDTNFDNDGKALTEMGSLRDSLRSLEIQPDGKIVAAGHGSFSDWNIELARYNADGSLDTNFDDDGRVVTDLVAGQDDYANAAAIQADGKIIIGGFTGTFSEPTDDAAFVRYNADGSLDTGFDFSALDTTADQMNPDSLNFAGDGKVVIPIGGGDDRIFDIALQPNGKIVAVGSAVNGAKTDFAMIRLNGSPIAPTASTATISGRVTMGKGKSVNRAVVSITDSAGNTRTTLTDPFGYYRFEDVEAGQNYILTASSKRYRFAPQVVWVGEDLENLDFTGDSIFPE